MRLFCFSSGTASRIDSSHPDTRPAGNLKVVQIFPKFVGTIIKSTQSDVFYVSREFAVIDDSVICRGSLRSVEDGSYEEHMNFSISAGIG